MPVYYLCGRNQRRLNSSIRDGQELGMGTVEELFVELRLLKIGDFRTRGPHIPPELASKIKALCDVFASAGSEEQSAMISLVQPSFSFVFLWFAKEMAVQAVRQDSQQAIVDGVM